MGSPAEPVERVPVALTIAGSDSGGGAGIQADLKVFFALGCHGTAAVTALTAQNTKGVHGVHPVPAPFVARQIDAVMRDLRPRAAKTGMLASREIVEIVGGSLEGHALPLVVDPVFISAHRDRLLDEDAVGAIAEALFPLSTVVTPNLWEAEALVGRAIEDVAGMEEAARQLHGLGCRSVLLKGGHLAGERAIDVFFDGDEMLRLEGPRYETEDTHGTGCALSAAITAALAQGKETKAAVHEARMFIEGAIRHGLRLGGGYGPVNPGWRTPGAAGTTV